MSKELQEEYIRVKDKLDKLQSKYWCNILDTSYSKDDIRKELLDTYTLLKSLNKQLYYGEQ